MRYRLTALGTLPAGSRLDLTEAQASARAHALRSLGGGEYLALAQVNFKAGEVIGYVGDLPKSWGAIACDEPVAHQTETQTEISKPRRGRAKKVEP